jgi:hypothetical protein
VCMFLLGVAWNTYHFQESFTAIWTPSRHLGMIAHGG